MPQRRSPGVIVDIARDEAIWYHKRLRLLDKMAFVCVKVGVMSKGGWESIAAVRKEHVCTERRALKFNLLAGPGIECCISRLIVGGDVTVDHRECLLWGCLTLISHVGVVDLDSLSECRALYSWINCDLDASKLTLYIDKASMDSRKTSCGMEFIRGAVEPSKPVGSTIQ
jgi:hypothetical protein